MKILDDDETKLEEDLEIVSEGCKSLFELYTKNKRVPIQRDPEGNIKTFRKHSFVQKYLERRKNLKPAGKIA